MTDPTRIGPPQAGHRHGEPVRSKNVRYLPGVDHLRAFASVLIIVYHGVQLISGQAYTSASNPLSALVIEGHTAVGLFMVLSGFILTYGVDRSDMAYGRFMKNRVLRVVPLSVVVLVIGVYTFPGEYTFDGLLQFVTLQATPPLAIPAFGAWSAMLWTISVEFAFYLVFPLLIRFLQSDGIRYLLVLLVLTNVLRLLSSESNPAGIRDVSYWTIVGRIDQFVLGMIGAWVLRRGWVRLSPQRWLAVAVGAAVVVLMVIWWFNRNGSFPASVTWKAPWPLVEGAAWALFVVAYVSASNAWTGRWVRWVALVGTVSFSSYLLHYVIVDLVRARGWSIVDDATTNAVVLTLLVILPATLCLATVSYWVIERPFMQMRVRYIIDPAATSDSPQPPT